MDTSVKEIAELVGGVVVGDGETRIAGLRGIQEAGAADLTFLGHPKYLPYLETTAAAAVLVPSGCNGSAKTLIQVENPYWAFARVLAVYEAEHRIHPSGVHAAAEIDPSASVAETAVLDANVVVAADAVIEEDVVLYAGVYVGRGTKIGAGTIVYPNTTIREDVTVGRRCIIHSNVAIGSDGFGFIPVEGRHAKIPQVGTVVIGDDVEIGSNTAIDRATCGATIIGDGTKIDNLVQIGHNVQVGKHCTVSGSTGISGSATIGDHVTVGGQAGINGHITVGDSCIVAARSGVTKSLAPNEIVSGFPAVNHAEAKRILVGQKRIPEALQEIRRLKERITQLEQKLDGQATDG